MLDQDPNCLTLMVFLKEFIEIRFSKNSSSVANSLDPNQAPHFVGPDQGLNCLHTTDGTISGKRDLELTPYSIGYF